MSIALGSAKIWAICKLQLNAKNLYCHHLWIVALLKKVTLARLYFLSKGKQKYTYLVTIIIFIGKKRGDNSFNDRKMGSF